MPIKKVVRTTNTKTIQQPSISQSFVSGPKGDTGATGLTGEQGDAGPKGTLRVPILTANTTFTHGSIPAGAFHLAGNRAITGVDLSPYNQVRLVARVLSGSTPPTNVLLRGRFSTTFSTDVNAFSQIGITPVEVSAALSGSFVNSGWIDLTPDAMADVFVNVDSVGGTGGTSLTLGSVSLDFRAEGQETTQGPPGPQGAQGPTGPQGVPGITADGVTSVVSVTQAEYDLLTPNTTTLYIIED